MAELPRRAVQKLPQGFGALLVESGMDALRTRGVCLKSIRAPLVEGMDGVAHRLLGAAEVGSYLRDLDSPGAGQ